MEGDSPPSLWGQPSAAFLPNRRRRHSSPPILNPVVLILLIPILCLLLIFFLLPPFLSHTSQFLRAGSVKQSWDSFNVLLVICAILCGVFARRNDDGDCGSATTDNHTTINTEDQQSLLNSNDASAAAATSQWFMQDRPSPMIRTPAATASGSLLRRSSSSYPDLRNQSLWETDERRFRFFDDIELNHYRAPPAPLPAAAAATNLRHLPAARERRTSAAGDRDDDDFLVKEIPVDTFVVNPPPPENQPNPVQRRTFQNDPSHREEKVEEPDQFQIKIQTDQPPPPTPLVTEEAIANRTQERKLKRSDRKKSGSAKDIATAIATSIYNQRKRKRRTKTRNIYESASPDLFQQAELEHPTTPPTAPPPPPPPPPPPSFFQNIFKKGGKTKRVHSFSVSVSTPPPPPPPPPPPRSLFNNLLRTGGGKSKRFQSASTPPPPPVPPPPPSSIFNNIFKSNTKSKRFNSNSTPPPPPPPPPPSSTFRNMFRTISKNKRLFDPITRYPPLSEPQSPQLHTPPPSDSPRRRITTAGRPPLPTKMNHYHDGNENINSGGQSPLIQIPSPPPLPPFRIPEMNFVARGDFVRIRSTHSSRCSSPGLDDIDFLPSRSSDAADIGDAHSSITSSTCPSPDVNLKADSFIARLRGEWRTELMNSERRKIAQQP